MTDRYKIVRYYYRTSTKRTLQRNLTLEEAQAHCKNPETSSKTATSCQRQGDHTPSRAMVRWLRQ